jgi:hypothetical protein
MPIGIAAVQTAIEYAGLSLVILIERPGADQHAVVVWGGCPEKGILTRCSGPLRGNACRTSVQFECP